MLRLIRIQYKIIKNQCRFISTKPLTSLYDRGFVKEVFPSDARYCFLIFRQYRLRIVKFILIRNRNRIEEICTESPQHIYAGFDPTADSLHIGNLLVIIGLIHFQRAGHHPVALVGGATGRIGDPSGKSTERNALENDELNHNLKCIKKQLRKIFENHENYLWNDQVNGKLKPVK